MKYYFSPGDIDHHVFLNEYVNAIYKIGIREVIPWNETYWQVMLAESCTLMEEYNFNRQPSVNYYHTKPKNQVNIWKQEEMKQLSKINLLVHTCRVVSECISFLSTYKHDLWEKDRVVLLFACIFHDFGKAVGLMKAYRIVGSVDEIRMRGHAEISAKFIEKFQKKLKIKYESNLMIIDILDDVKLIVRRHHRKDDGFHNPSDLYLQMIDRRAREKELALLHRKEHNKDI